MPLDPAGGEAGREEGMARADTHAAQLWKAVASAAVSAVAGSKLYFTSEDVLVWMEENYPDVHTHELRALGPVMRRAQSQQLCLPTDEFRLALRASRHRAPLRVWRSQLIP